MVLMFLSVWIPKMCFHRVQKTTTKMTLFSFASFAIVAWNSVGIYAFVVAVGRLGFVCLIGVLNISKDWVTPSINIFTYNFRTLGGCALFGFYPSRFFFIPSKNALIG